MSIESPEHIKGPGYVAPTAEFGELDEELMSAYMLGLHRGKKQAEANQSRELVEARKTIVLLRDACRQAPEYFAKVESKL